MTTFSESAKEEFVNWEELDIPETIYKYRTWDDAFHKTILTHLQVFLSPPKMFSDPLDCKNPIRYDLLSDEDIRWYYYNNSKTTNTEFNEDQHQQFAEEWFQKSPIRDKEFIKQSLEKDFNRFNDRIGILSLTADPANIDMWNSYSALHTGICVGFNSRIMFQHLGGGSEVTYCSELPIIKPHPWEDRTIQSHKQVYYKLNKWEFEKEYRTQHFSYNPLSDEERIVTLPRESYKEIIFGTAIKQDDKEEIIKICRNLIPNIVFKQAVLNTSDNKISIEEYASE
jgi:hypothetical protein